MRCDSWRTRCHRLTKHVSLQQHVWHCGVACLLTDSGTLPFAICGLTRSPQQQTSQCSYWPRKHANAWKYHHLQTMNAPTLASCSLLPHLAILNNLSRNRLFLCFIVASSTAAEWSIRPSIHPRSMCRLYTMAIKIVRGSVIVLTSCWAKRITLMHCWVCATGERGRGAFKISYGATQASHYA